MSKIGQRLLVHPTSATNIIQRLHAQGFVERVPNPDDGRAVLAEITAEGRDLVETATADLVGAGFGLDALDDAGLRALSELLRPVRKAAGDY
jgi:DNA-binding MarR family transcriptional regulator